MFFIGILQTNTFLYLTDSEDPLNFISNQLKETEEWKWPELLGLQLVGLRADEETPLSGKFQTDCLGVTVHNILAFSRKKEAGKKISLVRSEELQLLWINKQKPMTWQFCDQVSTKEVAEIRKEVIGFFDQQKSLGIISEKN